MSWRCHSSQCRRDYIATKYQFWHEGHFSGRFLRLVLKSQATLAREGAERDFRQGQLFKLPDLMQDERQSSGLEATQKLMANSRISMSSL